MPSWQARLISSFIRLAAKRRPDPKADETKFVRMIRAMLEPPRVLLSALTVKADVQPVDEGGLRGEWVVWTEHPQRTVYYLHGGGYVACSPATHRSFTSHLSRAANARIFSLDYRRAPEHRFPAAVEDAVNGYRRLLELGEEPANMVIGGDSAGGGLTLATLVSLRDAGLPLPHAAFLLSPWTDLACTGQSLDANEHSDPLFYAETIRRTAPVYYGAASPSDPLVSPLYADLSRLPPLLLYASDSETLLDDSTRLAERAAACGVKVDLRVWRGLPHGWPVYIAFKLPEARLAIDEIAQFIQQGSAVLQDFTAGARAGLTST
jgi:acetyl esterase/lipase